MRTATSASSTPRPTPAEYLARASQLWSRSLRKRARQIRRAARHEGHAHYRRQPVEPNVVFYESFAGNGMLCNPEAIFRALLADPEFAHLTHVWSLRKK